jgi:hypothetical protein
MWRCVDLVLTNVSEERIASICRVAKFASEALALAGGCRLSHQWPLVDPLLSKDHEISNYTTAVDNNDSANNIRL